MDYMITKRWKAFIDKRSPVTATQALDAIEAAHGAAFVVEITDQHGAVITEAQLRKLIGR